MGHKVDERLGPTPVMPHSVRQDRVGKLVQHNQLAAEAVVFVEVAACPRREPDPATHCFVPKARERCLGRARMGLPSAGFIRDPQHEEVREAALKPIALHDVAEVGRDFTGC